VFFIVFFELVILASLGIVASYQFRYRERIYPGVSVAGIPLDGMSLDEARRSIEQEMTPYPGETLFLRWGDRMWVLGPDDLGVGVDAKSTAALAYAVGRKGVPGGTFLTNLGADLPEQWGSLAFGRHIEPVLQYDEGKIAVIVHRIADEVNLAPREATLSINGLDINTTPGYAGRQLNADELRYALNTLARVGAGGVIDLEVQERPPAIISAEDAATTARALLDAPLIMTAEGVNGEHQLAVDEAMMRDWLTFTTAATAGGKLELKVEADREKIAAYLKEVAKQIDLPASEATLDFDPASGRVIVLTPSETGQRLDQETAVGAIEQAILSRTRSLTLPMVIDQPRVDSSKTAEMGIKELVSTATTYFKGSSKERVHNIIVAAEKFEGVVVPPGEQFSFNEHVGAVSVADGFVDSLIIRGDRTETGVGGGVCQVSTTAFQAAFWGGFPILERYPHSYAVGYYNPPGLDATIYSPTADFRFLNDTGHFLLIKPQVEADKSQVTFRIYGTKDRDVEMVGKPEITNVRKPEPPIYEESAALATGKIKQVDWAKDGMDVVVKRQISFNDGTVKNDKFVSKYRPWRAVYQYGPGTQVPTN